MPGDVEEEKGESRHTVSRLVSGRPIWSPLSLCPFSPHFSTGTGAKVEYLDFREPFSAWSHAAWLLLSLPATFVLCRKSSGDRAKRLSLFVFGLTLSACYLGSTLFHGVRSTEERIMFYDRLDHVGIHLLIAGSYTPLAWNLLRGKWRVGTLLAVWTSTLAGSTMLLLNVQLSPLLATCEYMTLGWGAIFCYFEISRTIPHRHLRPLVIGGLFYSIGAVLNLLQWPNLWPGVFGPHDMFHLWVMAGSCAHFWFMLTVIADTPKGLVRLEPLPVLSNDPVPRSR